MGIVRTISIIITPLCVAACGGGGGGDVIQQNIPTTSRATETTTTLLSPYSTTSSIGQSGQIYVLERLSLGAQKRLSAWSNETYQEQFTLEHVLIEENGTIYGTPTPSPAATLHYTADGTATGYIVYNNDAYQLSDGNVVLSLNSAQGGTLTLDRFNVTPLGIGQQDLENLTIDVSNFDYLGACGSADFCSNTARYAFSSAGNIPLGTTVTGTVLGGVFGPNGENAGALLEASHENTVEFRGDFVASRTR